jgi:hypothetical protein
MENVKIGACGPAGVRPKKESGQDLILMALGVAGFLLAFAALARAMRTAVSNGTLIPLLGLASLAGLGVAVWAVVRMWRRGDDAALMNAGSLGIVVWTGLIDKWPEGSPLAVGSALLMLAPASLFAWSIFRLARRADELYRRIALEGLAFGAAVSLFAALTGAALESAGLPRFNWAWMAAILVVSCGVGIVLANRRYQ